MKATNILLFSSLVIGSQVHAADAVVSDDFKEIMTKTSFLRSYVAGPNIEGENSYILTDNRNLSLVFSALEAVVEVGVVTFDQPTNNYLSVTANSDYSSYTHQCVGFVKAVSSLGHTRYWTPIENGYWGDTPFSKGDIIATFDNNDYQGHVAIVVSTTNDGAWVMDQNWVANDLTNGGVIRLHFIDNQGTGQSNIENYSLFEY